MPVSPADPSLVAVTVVQHRERKVSDLLKFATPCVCLDPSAPPSAPTVLSLGLLPGLSAALGPGTRNAGLSVTSGRVFLLAEHHRTVRGHQSEDSRLLSGCSLPALRTCIGTSTAPSPAALHTHTCARSRTARTRTLTHGPAHACSCTALHTRTATATLTYSPAPPRTHTGCPAVC